MSSSTWPDRLDFAPVSLTVPRRQGSFSLQLLIVLLALRSPVIAKAAGSPPDASAAQWIHEDVIVLAPCTTDSWLTGKDPMMENGFQASPSTFRARSA
jgi:hypothetical protein